MLGSFKTLNAEVNAFFDERVARGQKVAVWGASHQGFTLIAACGLADRVAYIIDSAPFKQNRFAPASHVPIVGPDHWFDEHAGTIIIIAPGYTDEIAGVIRTRFGSEVEVVALRSNCLERV